MLAWLFQETIAQLTAMSTFHECDNKVKSPVMHPFMSVVDLGTV